MNDLIIGNIVGSNIFNLLSILATSAFISPLPLPRSTWTDWFVMMISSMLPLIFCFRGAAGITRKGGLGLIAFYIIYLLIQLGRSQ